MTEGDEKASETLRVRPLLPIESDWRFAREVAEVAGAKIGGFRRLLKPTVLVSSARLTRR